MKVFTQYKESYFDYILVCLFVSLICVFIYSYKTLSLHNMLKLRVILRGEVRYLSGCVVLVVIITELVNSDVYQHSYVIY